MSYYMQCGKQTDNENFVCDECSQRERMRTDAVKLSEGTRPNGAVPPHEDPNGAFPSNAVPPYNSNAA